MEIKPVIFDTSDGQELRINTISSWMKTNYSEMGLDKPAKVIKLALDGGFTCPNRDGRKGTGGCLFCSDSGSGDMASRVEFTGIRRDPDDQMEACGGLSGSTATARIRRVVDGQAEVGFAAVSSAATRIRWAMADQIDILSEKWPPEKYDLKYIAYFQNHTNTYAPADELRELFYAALEQEDVIGLAIATRTDCLPDDVLELLEELNGKTFLWVELGLQTIHDSTAKAMNLCHNLRDYDEAAKKLRDRNIRIVTHLILGLPGETKEMMLQSVRYACSCPIFGLKLHMLNVVKGSGMAELYHDYVPFDTMEEYIGVLIETVELVPECVTLHRISGDAPRATLISPEWSYRKRTILNGIHRKMKELNTWQGRRAT